MTQFCLSSAAIAVALSTSAAACPTADAVAGAGVVITDIEGTTAIHQKRGDTTSVQIEYSDGFAILETRLHGLYVTQWQEGENGKMYDLLFDIDFGAPPAAPLPDTTTQTSSVFTVGEVVTQWSSVVTMGSVADMSFDDCTLSTFPVTLEMQGPLGPVQVETYFYFSDLGIAHLQSSGVGNMVFDTALVSIEAVQ